MESDVCKHCTHAGCLDVCPTGALFRTEFGTVVVQEDICNGCGYCVPACPFGVHRQARPAARARRRAARAAAARQEGGRARLEVHALLRPAEGRARAGVREGVPDRLDPVRRARRAARARGKRGSRSSRRRAGTARSSTAHDPDDGVGGFGAFFLLLDEPEVYGLPPDPVVPTRTCRALWQIDRARGGRDVRRHRRRVRREAANERVGHRGGTTMQSYYGRTDRQGAGVEAGDPRATSSPAASPAAASVLHGVARAHGQRPARAVERSTSARPRSVVSPGAARSPTSAGPSASCNMLRMFKVTSPMSVGSWILFVSSGASNTAAALELLGILRPVKWAAEVVSFVDRAAARDVHRRAAREHRDPGLERGARRAAVALRRERGGERRRGRGDLHAAASRRARRGAPRSPASPRSSG